MRPIATSQSEQAGVTTEPLEQLFGRQLQRRHPRRGGAVAIQVTADAQYTAPDL